MLKNLFKSTESYLLIVLLAFIVVVGFINPKFFTIENLFDLLRSSSGMAILAMGFFIVLLSGGIDVSFTAIAISAQYIAVNSLIASGVDNLAVAFLIAVGVGIAAGAINAVFIGLFNVPTLITTLGTMSLFHGALLEFMGTKAVNTGGLPECFKTFGHFDILNLTRADGTEYGLSVFFLILVIVVVVTWFILKYTQIGRGVYAIGGNKEAAKRAGFNIPKIQFFIYMYVGLLAGIMGIMHVSLIRYSNPNYIVGSELGVIAAVVIGGTRITGGRGTILGTLVGVGLIVVLEKNLVLIGLSSYWHQFFIGLIIIIGVSITYLQNKIRSKKNLIFVRDT
ncbi:MAG: ABC transporter permease [Spirochaetales bacterium]|nr:ABC transporter permease [Spirochaetales bacterium]MCF7937000.1 ABC transporter permease [Spirochaetales bacterium]